MIKGKITIKYTDGVTTRTIARMVNAQFSFSRDMLPAANPLKYATYGLAGNQGWMASGSFLQLITLGSRDASQARLEQLALSKTKLPITLEFPYDVTYSGNAYVETFDVQASLGNAMSGTFVLKGVGPLTAPIVTSLFVTSHDSSTGISSVQAAAINVDGSLGDFEVVLTDLPNDQNMNGLQIDSESEYVFVRGNNANVYRAHVSGVGGWDLIIAIDGLGTTDGWCIDTNRNRIYISSGDFVNAYDYDGVFLGIVYEQSGVSTQPPSACSVDPDEPDTLWAIEPLGGAVFETISPLTPGQDNTLVQGVADVPAWPTQGNNRQFYVADGMIFYRSSADKLGSYTIATDTSDDDLGVDADEVAVERSAERVWFIEDNSPSGDIKSCDFDGGNVVLGKAQTGSNAVPPSISAMCVLEV